MSNPSPFGAGPVFSMVPMFANEGTTVQAFSIIGPSPWGVAGSIGLSGTRKDGVKQLTLAYEYPWELYHAPTPIPKEEEERLQLERFRTDFVVRGTPLSWKVRPGNNPPDFIVEIDGKKGGLDVTRFSITERMRAQALFRKLREQMAAQPRDDFMHLTGSTVYIWFDKDGFSSLPHRHKEDIDGLIAALRNYEFDPLLSIKQAEEGITEQLGDIGIDGAEGAHFVGVPMRGATPSSHFFLTMGFEVAMAYQTDHDATQAWDEIRRLIDRHDKPEIENLLITVGAPDRYGLAYPSEVGLMSFALETDAPELRPKHIQSILVHFWMDGTTFQLHPWIGSIGPPLYQGGFFPGHFALAPPQTTPNADTIEGVQTKG
jgi:hypothetical protein